MPTSVMTRWQESESFEWGRCRRGRSKISLFFCELQLSALMQGAGDRGKRRKNKENRRKKRVITPSNPIYTNPFKNIPKEAWRMGRKSEERRSKTKKNGEKRSATTLPHFSKCSRLFIQSIKSTLSYLKSCNPIGAPRQAPLEKEAWRMGTEERCQRRQSIVERKQRLWEARRMAADERHLRKV